MHPPRIVAAMALGAFIATAAGYASAQQIYKWKDVNGVVHFSQTPPATGAKYSKVHLDAAPEVSSTPAPTSSADTGGDASAQQPATPEPTTQPDTPANRAELCKQLTSNITLLQSKQPLVTNGTGGKQIVMSDNAREQELATARAQQTQYCSSKGG